MTDINKNIFAGREKRKRRWLLVSLVLFLLMVFLSYLMMTVGNTNYSLKEIFAVILGKSNEGAFTIISLRLPRTLSSILAGISFGMSGYIFQTIFRNPLASPDIIGVSSASALAAIFSILILKLQGAIVSTISIVFGLFVALLIYVFAYQKGHFSRGKFILIGIGMQAMVFAMINYILQKASSLDVGTSMQWLSGSLSNVKLNELPVLAIAVIFFASILLVFDKYLDPIMLGDDYAISLGVDTKRVYIIMIISAVGLLAFATATTGPIASVAFLSGPIATRLVGKAKSGLIASAFMGIILIQLADLVGQNLTPSRYPVGVITGILGALYLLFILIIMKKKGVGQ